MTIRRASAAILALLLTAGVLSSCGGAVDRALETPAGPAPTATSAPPPTTPAPTLPTAAARAAPGDADEMKEDPFLLGERIFQSEAAEGVGCSYCHGTQGRGDIGPNIRGKSGGDIRFALGAVDAMGFIHLNEEEIEAVSEYLKWLASQP